VCSSKYASVTAYGHTITDGTQPNVFSSLSKDKDDYPLLAFIVCKGATWDINDVTSDMTALPNVDIVTMKVESGGTMNFKNTNMKFKGSFEVAPDGVLNIGTSQINTRSLTNLDGVLNTGVAQIDTSILTHLAGTITNAGTINNYGTIRNTGDIYNEGTLNNEGAIDTTGGHIYSDTAISGITGGTVEPLTDKPYSSSSGCNAGFGLLGLLPLAVWAARKRMTA
jgi:hypothetical protein